MATKVPLNFMWADESVLIEDIQWGISSDMVKWATDFYNNKDLEKRFELDVSPLYPLTKSRAAKFVLAKSSGVTPDLRPIKEVLAAEKREEARLRQQTDESDKELEDLDKRDKLLSQLLDTIEKERDDLSLTRENTTDLQEIARIKTELVRVRQEKASALTSKKRISDATAAAKGINRRLYSELAALIMRMDEREEVLTGDRMFRVQMALRYVLEGIGSERRINVIFCKANVSFGKYQVHGETRDELPDVSRIVVLPGQFLLWPYQYIVINLSPGHRSTLAHEVVHLWGHNHPKAQTIYKGIKKLPLLGIGLPEFEEIPGGYFDGTEKDIMNYKRRDPDANDTIMSIYDKVQLKTYLENLANR